MKPDGLLSTQLSFRVFSYEEMKAATNGFHASNKIGEGGFGTVYQVIFAFLTSRRFDKS